MKVIDFKKNAYTLSIREFLTVPWSSYDVITNKNMPVLWNIWTILPESGKGKGGTTYILLTSERGRCIQAPSIAK